MLVIHWTKHNNIKSILANGIRQSVRTRFSVYVNKSGEEIESNRKIRGIWCYPYTRNKTLNNQWKRNLKSWEIQRANFNGVVIRLTKDDFPLYAGEFCATGPENEHTIMRSLEDLKEVLTKFPSQRSIDPKSVEMDTDEFEIILLKNIKPERIIKVIKDRSPQKKLL